MKKATIVIGSDDGTLNPSSDYIASMQLEHLVELDKNTSKVTICDPKGIKISILKEEHINGATEIFIRTFCSDEPLVKYLGISHDAFRPFAIQVANKAAKDQLSAVACNSTGHDHPSLKHLNSIFLRMILCLG